MTSAKDISKPRAIIFIDGNNWQHGLRRIGVKSRGMDYRKVAQQILLDDKELGEIRYYVGKVSGDIKRMRDQEGFLKTLRAQQVNIFLGRIEKNEIAPGHNPLIIRLKKILANSTGAIPDDIRRELRALTAQKIPVYAEKQVDVRIAIDLVGMAARDEYDIAYLFSADGDFVPAAEEVRRIGKQIYAVSPSSGMQLRAAVDGFIRLRQRDWFCDCYE